MGHTRSILPFRMGHLVGLGLLGLAASLLGGCGDDVEVQTIQDVRAREEPRRQVPKGLTSAERYGFPSGGGGHDPHGAGEHHAAKAGPSFGWSTPEGWDEQPRSGSSMRKGSWKIAGEPRTDCSLVVLGGTGGGLTLNVNRWRKEMGLAEIDDAAITALPRRELLTREAIYVDFVGTFGGGRGGGGSLENARMLGLILALPQATLFLKFTGPLAVVEAEQGAFEALSDSITLGVPKEAAPTKTAPRPNSGAQGPKGAGSGFVWDTPKGWAQQPARMMRVVTFIPEAVPTSWCYVA